MGAVKEIIKSMGVDAVRKYMSPRERAKRYLGKSMASFKEEYDAYWSKIKSDPSLTSMKKEYAEIKENGFTIVENFLSEEELKTINGEIQAIGGLKNGKYEGDIPFTDKPDDGLCSLSISEALPTTYNKMVKNEELFSLAQALYGPEIKLSASSVLNKYDPTKTDSSIAPHWDDWRVRFKTFVYLHDVTEDHAATIYLKGSIKDVPWRFEKDFASVFLPIASAGGSWWPVEQLGFEKVVCTGKAGTAIVFDTGGIHAGAPLKRDQRLMLMNMYTTHLPFVHRVY